jgi:hypothetical protein
MLSVVQKVSFDGFAPSTHTNMEDVPLKEERRMKKRRLS